MDVQYLQDAAEAVSAKLPDNHGFIIFAVPFGDDPNRCLRYVSNLSREDAILILKEWLIKAGASEDWMKHIR